MSWAWLAGADSSNSTSERRLQVLTHEDRLFFTDGTTPPAVRAFHLALGFVEDVATYTIDDLAPGVTENHPDGYARVLRPRGIAMFEESGDRTSIYWADAGAGAILGVRLDGTPIRIAVNGLHTPEQLAIDMLPYLPRDSVGQPIDGPRLYWGDTGTNKIQRCRLWGTEAQLWACAPSEIEDIHSNMRLVQGLAGDWATSRLFWADGMRRGLYESETAGSTPELTVRPSPRTPCLPRRHPPVTRARACRRRQMEVSMPTCITVEESVSAGEGSVFFADQQTPPSVSRLFFNGSFFSIVAASTNRGISQPRALVYHSNMLLIGDAGTGEILLADSLGGWVDSLYQRDGLSPHGFTLHGDAQLYRLQSIMTGSTSGASRCTAGSVAALLVVLSSWFVRRVA
tara:strand:- start:70 stop:1266 length:1197 start_codon:yes stop_codon:yes gene_type:complete